jgi:isocitrate dehydrogenase
MTVVGSNSISNTVAVTPGGAGVNQAFNVAALSDVTSSQTATAYSIAQQLISTAWSILFALVLMVWVFGWGGGKNLVQQSYEEAKKKAEEQKARKAAQQGGLSDAPDGSPATLS